MGFICIDYNMVVREIHMNLSEIFLQIIITDFMVQDVVVRVIVVMFL